MSNSRKDYIAKYKSLAVDTTAGTGLFPSVMLAQAIVESNNGTSGLASKYNNHFGIKSSKGWTGKSVNLQTREVVSGHDEMQGASFRVYPSVRDSYRDRVRFLTENTRYKNAGVFSAKTPLAQLKALQSAGYATDPKYAAIINEVLQKEGLGILDTIKANPIKSAIGFALVVSALIGGIYMYRKNK